MVSIFRNCMNIPGAYSCNPTITNFCNFFSVLPSCQEGYVYQLQSDFFANIYQRIFKNDIHQFSKLSQSTITFSKQNLELFFPGQRLFWVSRKFLILRLFGEQVKQKILQQQCTDEKSCQCSNENFFSLSTISNNNMITN